MTTAAATWAARLPLQRAAACAELRLHDGLELAVVGSDLWLRGTQELDDELDRELRKISGLRRFTRLADERLVPIGKTVPVLRLPEADWTAAVKFFRPRLQATRLPARAPAAIPIRIIRSASERPAAALMLEFAAFRRWAELASENRLRALSFVLSRDGRVFVRGDILPPLPGMAYWIDGALALPSGCDWRPRVHAVTIERVLRRSWAPDSEAAQDGLFVFETDGRWQFVEELAFVNANRAAVRATAAACATGGPDRGIEP